MYARNVYLVLNLSTRCVPSLWRLLWDKTSQCTWCFWHHLPGNNWQIWIVWPWFFPRRQRQNSAALYLWRHHLRKKLILQANPSSRHLCTMSHRMITVSQRENHTSQRTVANLNGLKLLTQLREPHLLSLLLWLVQANVDNFAPCHKEWLNPCPNKISLETKVCTTWFCRLLWTKLVKISSMTPTFDYRSGWGTLLPSMQEWWVTSCIFNSKCLDSQAQRNLYNCHQGSQWTGGLQQLDTAKKKQSPWRYTNSTFCMGTTTQAWSHNEQNQVTQGQVEPPWQEANLRRELFWDICTCCDMVCHKIDDHF